MTKKMTKKRLVKIFSLPSHQTEGRTSGVDFARIIQPMKALNGWNNDEIEFETHIYDAVFDKKLDWLKVVTDYDMIYFNYTANPWAFAIMGAMARKVGIPMIMDLDDGIWEIKDDNPAYNVYKKGSDGIKAFTAIVNEVDYITCTNRYLKNVISHNTNKKLDRIYIFDNYIDFDLYHHVLPFKDDGRIVLSHFGSTSHFIDLQNKAFVEGMDRIMKEYPNVIFLTVGAFVPSFKIKWGQRYEEEYGHQDIYRWIEDRFPEVMGKTDICVVPLDNNIYTRCKSAIKYLEMSSAKKPGVYQQIRQYQEIIDGQNGLLANTAEDWYKQIKILIDDKEKRKNMGELAYTTIHGGYQMKQNVDQYAEFFLSIDKEWKGG